MRPWILSKLPLDLENSGYLSLRPVAKPGGAVIGLVTLAPLGLRRYTPSYEIDNPFGRS